MGAEVDLLDAVEGEAIGAASVSSKEPALVVPDAVEAPADEEIAAADESHRAEEAPIAEETGAAPVEAEDGKAKPGGRGKPMVGRTASGSAVDDDKKKRNPFAAKDKEKKGAKEKSNGSGEDSARDGSDSARGKGTPRQAGGPRAGGATPRQGAKGRPGSKGGASPRGSGAKASSKDERGGTPVNSAEDSKKEEKERTSISGIGAKGKGQKGRRKVEEEVKEEANPFKDAPMMIAMVPLVARETEKPSSNPVGAKILTGSLMRVADEKELDGLKRMFVALDGDVEPIGWVTGLSKDGVENLKFASFGFEIRRATRSLVCREEADNNSKKLDDVTKDSLVRVMEERTMADNTIKAHVAKGDTAVREPIGWVMIAKENKDGSSSSLLDPIKPLVLSFDLKVHTAHSLSCAL